MDYNVTLSENVTDVLNRYSWPMGMYEEFCPAALSIDRYITPIWYVIGLFTNPLSIFIWLRPRMRKRNPSAIYLASLSLADFIFLWLHFLSHLQLSWEIKTFYYPGICELFIFMYMIPQYATPLIVLGFTVDRWIAVCKPFMKERYCTVRNAAYVVLGVILFSIVLCSAQPYIWSYDEARQRCYYRADPQAMNFTIIWNWVTEMAIFTGVPFCVLIFNILVICEIRKINKAGAIQIPHQGSSSNNAASTITLLSVSFYLIFTTFPVTLAYVLNYTVPMGDRHLTDEQIRADPKWSAYFMYVTIRKLIEQLCFSHYSCYFFVYCITGPKFREAFLALLPVKVYQALNHGRFSIGTRDGRMAMANSTGV